MFWKDFKKIRENIIIFSKGTESKLKKQYKIKIKTLIQNPYCYQRMEQSNELRRFFIDKYVIIYRVEQKMFLSYEFYHKSQIIKEKIQIS